MPNAKEIGKRLVRYRGNRTQTDIAYHVGVTQHAVAQWEAGNRIPRDEHKVKLAEILETTVERLFF